MPATTCSQAPGVTQKDRDWFLRMLPLIEMYVRSAAKRLPPRARPEFAAEAIANAYVAFCGLLKRGKEDVIHATPLAHFAIAHVRAGRQVGCRLNSEDAMSLRAQRMRGFGVTSLDDEGADHENWREAVLEDRRTSPADIAAFRIDFGAWLEGLAPRDRHIAKALAMYHSTQDVAQRFGVSSGRISQLRRELHRAWVEFHGDDACEAE